MTEAEIPAIFSRADVVVLPYREIDQSGVAFTALAFGRPLLVSDAGGLRDIAEHGGARVVPVGDPSVLHVALLDLLGDEAARKAMADAAEAAAAGPFSWARIAEQTEAVYRSVLTHRAG
jgi:glycosyltransferase involved in cell wall biosynthesis